VGDGVAAVECSLASVLLVVVVLVVVVVLTVVVVVAVVVVEQTSSDAASAHESHVSGEGLLLGVGSTQHLQQHMPSVTKYRAYVNVGECRSI